MWLIPSMSSASSAAPGCSTLPSVASASAEGMPIEFWVTLSGTPARRPFSWRGWKRRAWLRHLSGATILPPSMLGRFLDGLTSSPPRRRASHTASPGSDGETKTIAATATLPGAGAGRSSISSASSTGVDPPWSSSKTCQRGLWADTSEDSARRYRDWVMRSRIRSSLLRQTLARLTSGNGYSSWQWQTPNAHGFTMRRQVGQTERKELLLDGQVKTFPSSRPDETTSGGGLLLRVWTPPSCPRLNPKFQAWLMRWPPWLTVFAWEATEWTRWSRRLRSELSAIAQVFSNP